MNIEEFQEKFASVSIKEQIEVSCICGKTKSVSKEKVRENINKNEVYLCRSCSLKRTYAEKPMSEDTKNKISQTMTGLIRSEENKNNISEGKKAYFLSEESDKTRELLSIKAKEQHKRKKKQ